MTKLQKLVKNINKIVNDFNKLVKDISQKSQKTYFAANLFATSLQFTTFQKAAM